MLLAEAGLSECAPDAACSADLSRVVYFAFASLVLFSVWITLSMFATVDVVGHRLGLQRSVAWLSIVWIVPIVGATVWRLSTWWSERDPTPDSPTGW
ncbi:hypothetical protein [Gordonia sp. HS-NH1]|uniref:hypothetical protein n=1 Tax=Gordonia sp. HS-NH1 TaxID=1435068 RepID=UPI0012E26CFA|nr:hypothetical protein [Gordonia sp. HS-NH1]